MDLRIEVPSLEVTITPLAMIRFASDITVGADAIVANEGVSLARYYLFCLAIELALKAGILARQSSYSAKDASHDLVILAEDFTSIVDANLVNAEDKKLLIALNAYYYKDRGSVKALVYFEAIMKEQALKGYRNLPSIERVEIFNTKLQACASRCVGQ